MKTKSFIYALSIPILSLILLNCGGEKELGNKAAENDAQKNKKDIAAMITKITGEVKLLRKDKQYTVTRKDIPLLEGDTLVTRANSSVDVEFIGMGVSQLRPGSRLTVKRMAKGGDVALDLKKGKSLFILKKLSKDQDFEIQTPTGIAGVRGTSFAVDSKSKSTTVSVLTGKVALDNGKGSQVISEKQSSIATKSKVTAPQKMANVSLNDVKAILYIEGAQDQSDYSKMKENIKSLEIQIGKSIDDEINLDNDFSTKGLDSTKQNVDAKAVEKEEALSSQSQEGAFGGDQDIMLKK